MPLPPQTACRFSCLTLMLVNVYYGEEVLMLGNKYILCKLNYSNALIISAVCLKNCFDVHGRRHRF